jgi:hypothetical protein
LKIYNCLLICVTILAAFVISCYSIGRKVPIVSKSGRNIESRTRSK